MLTLHKLESYIVDCLNHVQEHGTVTVHLPAHHATYTKEQFLDRYQELLDYAEAQDLHADPQHRLTQGHSPAHSEGEQPPNEGAVGVEG